MCRDCWAQAAPMPYWVPLVRRRGAAHLLFEVRADTLNRQPGEVCFPGGRIEAGETPTTCALREMEEELSIPPDAVHLLAELDFLYHQSGTLIHPILAEVDAGALRHMRVNTAEVKDTFLVPFSFFLKHKPILYSYDLEPHIPEDSHITFLDTKRISWQAGKMDVPSICTATTRFGALRAVFAGIWRKKWHPRKSSGRPCRKKAPQKINTGISNTPFPRFIGRIPESLSSVPFPL